MASKKNKHKIVGLLTKALLLIAFVELLLSTGFVITGNHNLVTSLSAATAYRPVPFTELYFTDHANLPKRIELGKTESFSFTIRNLEHRTIRYEYEVYIPKNREKQIIDTGAITLKHGEKKAVNQEYTISLPNQRIQIVVVLKNKNQTIHFWTGQRPD